MKKTLSVLAVLGIVSFACVQSANAFSWSSLNPAYWGHCPKCEKKKPDCKCKKIKQECPTGYATPCDPCNKQVTQPQPCDTCDRLQEHMAK